MCGIAGIIYCPSVVASNNKTKLLNALKIISHRGPDSSGSFFNENIMLGHVRLSILDLSEAAKQPMKSMQTDNVITYNGEVYNFEALAVKHKIEERFSTSDTEIVLRLFDLLGTKSFEELNGMFAFSIYDKQNQKVYLVRDRFGIKPLYYKYDKAGLLFASEIKALKELDLSENTLNYGGLHEWSYFGNSLGDKTLFSGIEQLNPGCYLEFDLKSSEYKIVKYHDLTKIKQVFPTISESKNKVRKLLEQSVERQLISDVPVGVLLSGGIDSSAITAFASKHYNGTLSTYSIGFDFQDGVNELPLAQIVANKFNTDHHEIHISGSDIIDAIEKMVYHNDHPFSDAANLPLYLISSKVKDHTKVILQGDGGDEIFGGYRRYNTLSNLSKFKIISPVLRGINSFLPNNSSFYRRRRYLNIFNNSELYKTMALLLTVEECQDSPIKIFTKDIQNIIRNDNPFKRYKDCQKEVESYDVVRQMMLVDQQIILPDIFLPKVDRATMASSIEVRVPFLDNELVNYVNSLSGKDVVLKGQQKGLLKAALDGIIPDEILYGKKKGFGVPFEYWLKSSLKQCFIDELNRHKENDVEILNVKEILHLHQVHCSGKRNYGFLLWKCLNFAIWVRMYNIGLEK